MGSKRRKLREKKEGVKKSEKTKTIGKKVGLKKKKVRSEGQSKCLIEKKIKGATRRSARISLL